MVLTRLVLGCACALSYSGLIGTQAGPSIRWVTDYEKSTSENPGVHVIIGTQTRMVVRVSLQMMTEQGVLGWERGVERILVRVRRDGKSVPIAMDVGFVRQPTGSVFQSGEVIEARLVLQNKDEGVFEAGRYAVEIDLAPFLISLRNTDGSSWTGIARSEDRKVVWVKLPSTVAEQVRFHASEGFDRLDRREYQAAVDHFERVVSLQPDYWMGNYGLGRAYLAQKRYEAAVTPLRAALDGWLVFPGSKSRAVPENLARALLALGRDTDAAAALRAGGLPAEKISERIRQLRDDLNGK